MKFLLWSLILSTSEAKYGSNDNETEPKTRNLRSVASRETIENRIIGGDKAPMNAYPWFVLGSGCGGSLIAPDIVLTAGHCDDSAFSKVVIGAFCRGSDDTNQNNCGQYSEVRYGVRFVTHPMYDNGNDGHDLKLVQLNQASTITPVKIDGGYLSPKYTPGRDQLWTAGFGLREINPDRLSNSLMHLEKRFVDLNECERLYDLYEKNWIEMDNSMICVKNDNDYKSACFGDSGGPLYDARAKKVIGVVSTGPHDCSRLPIVYASVASEIQWIKDTVCDLSPVSNAPFFCGGRGTENNNPPTASPIATPSVTTTGSSQEQSFQVISRLSTNDEKWCLAVTTANYNGEVIVKPCDSSDSLQLWSSDSRGLMSTLANPNLCIENDRTEKALLMKICAPADQSIESTFIYDQFHSSLIWLRNKANFAEWGLRAVTVLGTPSQDDISSNKVFVSKREGNDNEKWDVYFPS